MTYVELNTSVTEKAAYALADNCLEEAIDLYNLLRAAVDHEEASRGLLAKKQAYEKAKLDKSKGKTQVEDAHPEEKPATPVNVGLTDEYLLYLSFMGENTHSEKQRPLSYEETFHLWSVLKVAIQQKLSNRYKARKIEKTSTSS